MVGLWGDFVPRPIPFDLQSRYCAAGTRMSWHPVPRRAAWLYLRAGALTCSRRIGAVTCSWLIKLRLLIFFVFYKESTGSFGLPFWLHQGRIPHRFCRFHCCLAAHQRTRKKDSAEPSFPILWTPPHPPGVIRCGGAFWLPRAWVNVGSCIPVLSLLPSSEFYLAVCVRA